MRRARGGPLAWCGVVFLLGLLLGGSWAEAKSSTFRVRHRTTSTVYLEGGSGAGLAVGNRLAVLRDEETIAEVEVTFVAGFSASCRVISESQPVEAGDLAVIQGLGPAMVTAAAESIGGSGSGPSQTGSSGGGPSQLSTVTTGSRPSARPPTRLSGVLGLEYESFADGSDNELDYDRSNIRLSLRGRDVGGLPLSIRVRTRLQEISRARELSGGVEADESRDRLYEVSARYDSPGGRYSLMGGRLGAGPFISIGYLDGLLAQVRAVKTLSVGGFYGNRPDITELGFDSRGTKYGGFLRFANDRSGGPQRYDVMIGGVREEGDVEVSREYVLLESYYQSAGVWSFFQRAEIDLNNDWREELTNESSQLSNLALSARARLSESARLVVSYDQFRQYRTEETRFISEELFDDLLRQGLRLALNFGRPGELNWMVSGGWRDQESAEDSAFNLMVGARHPDIGSRISLGGDVMTYSNLYSEGVLVRLRSSKNLDRGHEIYLELGTRFEEGKSDVDDETSDAWGRFGGWFQLPQRFFVRGEFEYAAGDSLEGTRLILGLGYRF